MRDEIHNTVYSLQGRRAHFLQFVINAATAAGRYIAILINLAHMRAPSIRARYRMHADRTHVHNAPLTFHHVR